MPLVNKEDLDSYLNKEVGVSDWFILDQDRINKFADATNDHQFIHINPELAAKTPFGSTVAHGFLTLSLLPYFAEQGHAVFLQNIKMAINYGLDRVRFPAPVKVGASIRARYVFKSYQEKRSGEFLLKHEVTIEIKDEPRAAMIAESLVMLIVDTP